MTSEVERALASLRDSTKTELKYDHYSLRINRERRTAFFAAANINGAQLWKAAQDGPRPPARSGASIRECARNSSPTT